MRCGVTSPAAAVRRTLSPASPALATSARSGGVSAVQCDPQGERWLPDPDDEFGAQPAGADGEDGECSGFAREQPDELRARGAERHHYGRLPRHDFGRALALSRCVRSVRSVRRTVANAMVPGNGRIDRRATEPALMREDRPPEIAGQRRTQHRNRVIAAGSPCQYLGRARLVRFAHIFAGRGNPEGYRPQRKPGRSGDRCGAEDSDADDQFAAEPRNAPRTAAQD